jgi:signal transduction histidine kinase
VLTKVDVEGKKITVIEKDSDKEIEIKITDDTERISKKQAVKSILRSSKARSKKQTTPARK